MLEKFIILDPQNMKSEERLINLQLIVSIKPSNFDVNGKIQKAYWIRTMSNRKLIAIEIPKSLEEKFSENSHNYDNQNEEKDELSN